jgi:hypothetical protein
MVVVVVVVVLLVRSLGANGRASPPTLPIWVSTSLILDPIVIQPTYSVNFSSSSLVSARVHTRMFFLVKNFQTMKAKKILIKKNLQYSVCCRCLDFLQDFLKHLREFEGNFWFLKK